MNTVLEFVGYPRKLGPAGIRNHLLILSTVICANRATELIGHAVPEAVVLQHPFGCSQIGNDAEQTFRTLAGFATNPNVGAVLVIGLGCETTQSERLAESITASGKPVELVKIQSLGGQDETVRLGIRLAHQMSEELATAKREFCPWAELTIGVHCADPDDAVMAWANPLVGRVSDFLVAQGGKVVFSEVPELLGATARLREMANTLDMASNIDKLLLEWQERVIQGDRRIWHLPHTDGPEIATYSVSCGSLAKAGKGPIQEVLAYGQKGRKAGLALMDTPCSPAESITGMIAGGATLILLTTGSAAPLGSPIAPIISMSANPQAVSILQEHIDLDLTLLQSGDLSIEDAMLSLVKLIGQVTSGQKTQTEKLGYRDFAIYRIGPTV